jgi:hypothetical protein
MWNLEVRIIYWKWADEDRDSGNEFNSAWTTLFGEFVELVKK